MLKICTKRMRVCRPGSTTRSDNAWICGTATLHPKRKMPTQRSSRALATFIAVVCRQVLQETFRLVFPLRTKFELYVKHGNLFPAVELLAILKRSGIIINASSVAVTFEPGKYNLSDIKRLVTMHWLFGVPLWNCITVFDDPISGIIYWMGSV